MEEIAGPFVDIACGGGIALGRDSVCRRFAKCLRRQRIFLDMYRRSFLLHELKNPSLL
jgi:hypothetical protein